jgi:hypothetical protein
MVARFLVRIGSRPLIVGEVLSVVLAVRACVTQPPAPAVEATGGDGGGGAAGGVEVGGAGGDGGVGALTAGGVGGMDAEGGGGMGGMGGMGGDGGGGAEPCEPNGATCENAPQGACGAVDSGCGVLDCSASCGIAPPSGDMTCSVEGRCQCAPFDPVNPSADASCANLNGGASRRCIGATPRGVPVGCVLLAGDTYCCTQ